MCWCTSYIRDVDDPGELSRILRSSEVGGKKYTYQLLNLALMNIKKWLNLQLTYISFLQYYVYVFIYVLIYFGIIRNIWT